jgi:hypothetical protein
MEVEWTLYNMDKIKNEHLQANLAYWKVDLLLNATRLVEKIEKSRFLKLISKGSDQLKTMVFLAQNRGQIASDDINSMVNYTVTERYNKNNVTLLKLYVNPSYFSMNEMVSAKMGRRVAKYMASKAVGRQELIDSFEGEIRKIYTKNFKGQILDDDGVNLSIFS